MNGGSRPLKGSTEGTWPGAETRGDRTPRTQCFTLNLTVRGVPPLFQWAFHGLWWAVGVPRRAM